MSRTDFYFPFYTRHWLTGTRHLSPEARGLYVDLLAMIYERGGSVPMIEEDLVPQLGLKNVRTLRRIMAELTRKEKIRIVDGLIFNAKAAEVTGTKVPRKGDQRPKVASSSSDDQPTIERRSPEDQPNIGQGSTDDRPKPPPEIERNQGANPERPRVIDKSRVENHSPPSPSSTGVGWGYQVKAVLEIFWPDDERIWLMTTGICHQWAADGWDLEHEVLPTIKAACQDIVDKGRDPPRSLSYFGAIIDRQRRENAGRVVPIRPDVVPDKPPAWWLGMVEIWCKRGAPRDQWLPSYGPAPGEEGFRGSEAALDHWKAWKAKQAA